MIPAAYVFLDQLPISANGKIDRKALPAPEVTAEGEPYVAPRTPVEQQLASIWADVLHGKSIGIRENFFEIGGHSLSAMQVVARIRKVFDLDVPVSCLFQSPTIESLAIAIDRMRVSSHSEEDLLRILEEIDSMPTSSTGSE
jgi:acyl carrier protein